MAFLSESSCRHWMNSLQKLLNRPTQPTWSRRSTSKMAFTKPFLTMEGGKSSIQSPTRDLFLILFLLFTLHIFTIFLMSFMSNPVNPCRVVRNANYGWRALRLLSRRSPHFFQPTNQKFKSLADYLDSMVSKLAKELPVRILFY